MNALQEINTISYKALLILKKIRLWIKDLVIWIRFIADFIFTLIFIF